MKKLALLVAIFAAFLFIIPFAHAGSIITVTKSENINGSIGLYIRNELGVQIKTDNTKDSTNVLSFSVNGSNVSVDSDRTPEGISKGMEALVVLRYSWPAGGYYQVDVTYKDAGGGFYPKETHALIAKQPISAGQITIEPEKVLSNYSKIVFTMPVSWTGEDSISNINFELVAPPKYFRLSDSKYPGALSKGATSNIVLTFERTDASFEDTIVYTTVFVPIKLTYRTLGFDSSQLFNESFVIFNSKTYTSDIPKMNARIDIPSEIERGKNTNVNVYVWNSNVGGHNACNATLTVSTNNPYVQIPASTAAPSGQFAGRVEETDSPTAAFELQTTSSTPTGNYTLTLNVDYKDCLWKNPGTFAKTADFSVKSAGEIESETPGTVSPKEETKHIINISTTQPKEGGGMPSVFLTIVAIIGVILLFAVVYFLEIRSRTIF